MIVPSPSGEWGHQRLDFPAFAGESAPVVNLIHFPGGEDLGDVDLLDYPFLYHELGHNLLFRYEEALGGYFVPELERFTNTLQRRALADRGTARQQAQRNVDEIRRLWAPSPNHHNWAHEIAVDMIALWTCGPAYLDAIQDIFEQDELNPYQIGQSHPPYEVRANALLAASDRIRWASYTGSIRRQIDAWRETRWRRDRTNRYLACASADLTLACVEASLGICRALDLPLCTPEGIREMEKRLSNGETPDLGSELLLAAWLSRKQIEEDQYVAWERDVVKTLCAMVML